MIKRLLLVAIFSVVTAVQAHDDMTCTLYRHPNAQLAFCIGEEQINIKLKNVGHSADAHVLTLKAIKKLAQAIPAHEAAYLYARMNKQLFDELIQTIPAYVASLCDSENSCDMTAAYTNFLHKMMQVGQNKRLDIAALEYALPKEVIAECQSAIAMAMQSSMIGMMMRPELQQESAKKADACALLTNILAEMFVTVLDALVSVLEQHYNLGRVALELPHQQRSAITFPPCMLEAAQATSFIEEVE